MNTNRRPPTQDILPQALRILTIAVMAISFLPDTAAVAANPAPSTAPASAAIDTPALPESAAPVSNPDLPPGATAEWWAAVQEQVTQDTPDGDRTILGLSPTPDWTATGENHGDWFAHTVASAGDVNGDGYADVIVGAYGFPSGSLQGRAYVYHGSPSGLAATPALTLTGENSGDCFGRSVAGAGDVNGDGYADAIIGAPYCLEDSGQDTVYVYHGSASGLGAIPALTLTGENDWDEFGYSVASAGDVNGDGYADVIVGAFRYPNDTRRGRAYVYHGSPTGLGATAALTLTGENDYDCFGYSVASAGDVNGDGYADAIVGVPYHNASGGRAYVYHGSSSGLAATPAGILTGKSNSEYFGYSVASAGDVNGDGYADAVVGAFYYGSYRGRAYVFHGSASGLAPTPVLTLTGEDAGGYFGHSVTGAGDVNGDGYADVIVGAYRYPSATRQGRAYVYHGSATGLGTTPALTLAGETDSEHFGYSVANAGDLDGDGYADAIVGARNYGGAQGRACAYHGSGAGLASTPALTLTGENDGDGFGASVASAGDVNGDGYADVIVGAYRYPGLSLQGRVYIYHGSASGLAATPALTLTGENDSDEFGHSVASAGDVNGDGYADIIVGASGYASGNDQGRAYVYHGSASGLATTPALTLTGENVDDYFGSSVASAGDLNGDGYADVIVGAPCYPSLGYRGRVYLYHGSASGLATTPALTLTGENDGDYFGHSAASAGDVNGDGYVDAIVGAPGYGPHRGRVYLYHGSPSGLVATPALSLTGQDNLDDFGISVASAGDVNGDGYADAIIGAPWYPNGNDRGRAYVYHGSPSGLVATPALYLTGEHKSDFFGVSVASTGDVDGDGYADAIIGAPWYPNSSDWGRTYLYRGSASGLAATPALTLTGENDGDFFGASVAGAGDVNGDGFADAVVGAFGYGNNQGRAYVYLGNDGGGRTVLSRQQRGDASGTPVQPWGLSYARNSFQVQMRATDPMGRGRVKLQVAVCPPGTPFGDEACLIHNAAAWTDVTTATSGITLTETITGLAGSTLYRWRARVLYAHQTVTAPGITPPPNPAHGPWRRLNGQAVEADVRTSELAWEKLVYVNGVLTDTLPFRVGPSDTVHIVDRVGIPSTTNITFTLVETWTTSLELTGWISDAGSVVTTANSLIWNVADVAPGTLCVITKTFHVLPGPWCTDTVTESLWVEDAAQQPPLRVVGFTHSGVIVTPPAGALSGDPGETVNYTLRITNTGNCSDTFDITVSGDDWTTTVLPTVGPLDVDQGADLAVAVDIPTDARCGDDDSATVTFTSQGDGVTSASSDLTTTANTICGVAISPSTDAQSGDPGDTVTYTLRITNTGNCSDTFGTSVVGNSWTTTAPPIIGPLGRNEGADVEVTVGIPPNAECSDADNVNISFTSQGDGAISTASTLTTSANTICGVAVVPSDAAQSGDPGTALTYTLRLTNTGNCSDTFSVTVSGNAWTTTVPATVGPLAVGQATDVEVSVDIPPGASCWGHDTATVTFTSHGDGVASDSSNLTTTVNTVGGVAVSPPADAQSGDPGGTVVYSLRLTNTGNCSNTFNAAISGNGWTTAVPAAVGPLDVGQGIDVEVTVDIPADAQCWEYDTAAVTFTSQGDALVSASSSLTTSANTICGVAVDPSADAQSGGPGTALTCTLRFTNTGNCTDTYGVSVSGNGWTTTVPATVGPLGIGEGINVGITVHIPTDAQCGDYDTATVTVTSQGDSVISASSVLTTSANAVFGVAVDPPVNTLSGRPGTTVTYTLRVTNAGNCSDTFDIEVAGNAWTTTVPLVIGPLAAGAGIDVGIAVHIPASANDGDFDVVAMTLTSRADDSVSGNSVLTTAAVTPQWRVYLPTFCQDFSEGQARPEGGHRLGRPLPTGHLERSRR